MKFYHQSQWLLLFFLYSGVGWLWECFYVSVRTRHLVNRGFLHGPWLPIYGAGALLVLFLTLPVRNSPALVFFLGMTGATLLEYGTGAVMERIFQMRYWDYSKEPLNVNGYICLPVSFAWGLFSTVLIYILHPPIERFVLQIPLPASDGISLGLSVLFTADVTRSVQTAMDLRAMIERLTASNRSIASIEEHLRLLAAQLSEKPEFFHQKLTVLEHSASLNREHLRNKKMQLLSSLAEKTASILEFVHQELEQATAAQERSRLEHLKSHLLSIQKTIHTLEIDLTPRKSREWEHIFRLLERNPSAASPKYREAFEELRSLRQKNKNDKNN